MHVAKLVRLQAQFLVAMGLVGCHSGASPDPSSSATTTTIPSSTATTQATASVAATDTAPPAPSGDAGALPPHFPPHGGGGGVTIVTLPDGGTEVQHHPPFLGRPLKVEGEARVAAASTLDDWTGGSIPELASLSASERAALAAKWSKDAASEHASIAAFSRLSLQLLALGAPPELVEAAHLAAIDETRHARDAYALASAFAGEAIGPAPLDVTGTLAHVADVTLARLAVETFEDGCINETYASVDAREKHAFYTDGAVHEVLGIVAEDEERHAELAWKIVAWAVRTGGENVKQALAEAVARAIAAPEHAQHPVFNAVVLPCANALLAS